jgi:hypothetical protein
LPTIGQYGTQTLRAGKGDQAGGEQKDSHQAKLGGCPSVVKIYPLIISLEYLELPWQ